MSHYVVLHYANDGVEILGVFDTLEEAREWPGSGPSASIQRWDRDQMFIPI
jgi:hypothetical protein